MPQRLQLCREEDNTWEPKKNLGRDSWKVDDWEKNRKAKLAGDVPAPKPPSKNPVDPPLDAGTYQEYTCSQEHVHDKHVFT